MLSDIRDRAAVLAAEAQSLDEAEQKQDDGGHDPDACVARHDANQCRGVSHAAEREEKRVLSADQIADPSEDEGAQRPDQESDGEQRDGAEERRYRMALLEKLDRQDRG